MGVLAKTASAGCVALVCLTVYGPGCAWGAARAPLARPTPKAAFVITPVSVGGLQISPVLSYRQALRYLISSGSPHPTAAFSVWGCSLVSQSGGVALQFDLATASYISHARATPATCTNLGRASVNRSIWHTSEGLSVGASLQKLRAIYPKAADEGLGKPPPGVPNWCAYWALSVRTTPGPVLFAYTTHGHIAALGVEFVGH